MIQRIQTLFLLIAVGLIALMYFTPVVDFIDPSGAQYVLKLNGIFSEEGSCLLPSLPLMILYAGSAVLILTDMFLYRKRILQMRVCVFTILVLVLGIGLLAFYIGYGKNELEAAVKWKIGLSFPLISAILVFLAYRNIRKDEEIIRAYDRIR